MPLEKYGLYFKITPCLEGKSLKKKNPTTVEGFHELCYIISMEYYVQEVEMIFTKIS